MLSQYARPPRVNAPTPPACVPTSGVDHPERSFCRWRTRALLRVIPADATVFARGMKRARGVARGFVAVQVFDLPSRHPVGDAGEVLRRERVHLRSLADLHPSLRLHRGLEDRVGDVLRID